MSRSRRKLGAEPVAERICKVRMRNSTPYFRVSVFIHFSRRGTVRRLKKKLAEITNKVYIKKLRGPAGPAGRRMKSIKRTDKVYIKKLASQTLRNRTFQDWPELISPFELPQNPGKVPKSGGPKWIQKWTPLRDQKAPKPFEFIAVSSTWAPPKGSILGTILGPQPPFP